MNWWDEHLRGTAAWLVHLSRHPGWVDHARHRAKELMASELCAELPRLMREAMQSASPSPSAPSAGSTPASTGGQELGE